MWNHELWQWTQRVHYIGRRVIAGYYWALHLPSPVLVPSSSQASSGVTVAPPCVLATSSSSSELWRQNVNICVLYPIMNGRVVTVVTMPPWKLWIYTSIIRQLGGGGNKPNEVCRLIAGLLHLPPPARCCCWCNVRILFCNVQCANILLGSRHSRQTSRLTASGLSLVKLNWIFLQNSISLHFIYLNY